MKGATHFIEVVEFGRLTYCGRISPISEYWKVIALRQEMRHPICAVWKIKKADTTIEARLGKRIMGYDGYWAHPEFFENFEKLKSQNL